jgi:hypothetical protein
MNKTLGTATNTISFTHYGDGDTGTGTTWTELATKTGYDVTMPVQHKKLGGHVFHSLKVAHTTADETGLEPLYLYFLYSPAREHKKDWR